MARRRANGEGTIYELPNGRWRVIVTARVAGKLKRHSRTRRKRSDCVALLDTLRNQINGGVQIDSEATVETYLRKWADTIIRPHKAEQTFVTYDGAIRKHLIPRLGTIRLKKLSPMHIEELKAAFANDGTPAPTRKHAVSILRRALKYAVHPLRLITFNPCDGIANPSHRSKKMNPFNALQAKAIIASAADSEWHSFYSLAFGCGLRSGELFALRKSDINFETSRVEVQRQISCASNVAVVCVPKTPHSLRTVDIPPIVLTSLKKHRAIQLQRGFAGCEWLFPNRHGEPWIRSRFYESEWIKRLETCQLPHRGFHNTRHTFATLAILAGVPIPVVSKALGHASPKVTMDIYAHVLPEAERGASDAMDRLLG